MIKLYEHFLKGNIIVEYTHWRHHQVRVALALPKKKANTVRQAIIRMLKPLRKFVKTITYDNGKEFVLHKKIANSLRCDSYFATPYHSWKKGKNENANGLLRQYFPKSMELNNVTEKEIIIAVDKPNNRPRKCLVTRLLMKHSRS